MLDESWNDLRIEREDFLLYESDCFLVGPFRKLEDLADVFPGLARGEHDSEMMWDHPFVEEWRPPGTVAIALVVNPEEASEVPSDRIEGAESWYVLELAVEDLSVVLFADSRSVQTCHPANRAQHDEHVLKCLVGVERRTLVARSEAIDDVLRETIYGNECGEPLDVRDLLTGTFRGLTLKSFTILSVVEGIAIVRSSSACSSVNEGHLKGFAFFPQTSR